MVWVSSVSGRQGSVQMVKKKHLVHRGANVSGVFWFMGWGVEVACVVLRESHLSPQAAKVCGHYGVWAFFVVVRTGAAGF